MNLAQGKFYMQLCAQDSHTFLTWIHIGNIFILGERVWGRDPFFERASEDVPSQARRVRAEAFITRAADQQDPAAVSESPGRQRAPPEAAATGEGLSDQRHHQQVSSVLADMWGWTDLASKPRAEQALATSYVYVFLPPPSGQYVISLTSIGESMTNVQPVKCFYP